MTTTQITGLLLISLPVAFNILFFLLGKAFEYPDILRKPTEYILSRFQQGGRRLIALWYAFMLTGILILPIAILLPQILAPTNSVFIALATTFGVLAGFVQVLGLIRWSFLVPYLARTYAAPDASQGTRDAVAVTFQAFHNYAGVAIGEHLGYVFTSVWTILIAVGVIQSTFLPAWFGWVGLIPALGILFGVLEQPGVKIAGLVTAISYILWSLWLIVLGIFLVLA